jgi:hypothetical protein
MKLQAESELSEEASDIEAKPIKTNSGNRAKLQNTLRAEPVFLSPKQEKTSIKDRRFSQKATKTIRKARTTP